MLVLRNSFLVIEKNWQERIAKLGFSIEDFFLSQEELLNRIVMNESKNEVKLNGSLSELEQLYESFKKQASAVDVTLEKHVEALKLRTVHHLQELEKKMLRAEKRKFESQQHQLDILKQQLFPNNSLQERVENISIFYAKYGKQLVDILLSSSLTLQQEFAILEME